MATLNSKWAQSPIQLTESLHDEIWINPGKMSFGGGFLLAKNDALFLYLAIDIVKDLGNDPGSEDYFWFSFDRDRDSNISPNYDVNYGVYPGTTKLGRQYYLGPNTWTGLINENSESICKSAFESSPNNATPHRIWKLKLKLADLNVSLVPWFGISYTRFGFRVRSANPSFTYNVPVGFSSGFSSLHTLNLSRQPYIDPAGIGPVIGTVGLIPASNTYINASTGKATTDPGYYVFVQNAAFGGRLNFIGNRTTLQNLYSSGAVKYKVFTHPGTSGGFTELRSAWYNYRWDGTDYVLDSFGPDAGNYYTMTNPGDDYSIDDLLIQFDSNTFVKGLHQFQVKFYNASNAEVPATAQTLTLYIDNQIPIVKLNYIRHAGVNVNACAIVNLTSATDGLTFNIDAYDPEGNLLSYALSAGWGNGQGETITSDTYTTADGVNWTGVQNHIVPGRGLWIPDETCAYSFTVAATARTTNGYGYIGYTSVSKYITLILP